MFLLRSVLFCAVMCCIMDDDYASADTVDAGFGGVRSGGGVDVGVGVGDTIQSPLL